MEAGKLVIRRLDVPERSSAQPKRTNGGKKRKRKETDELICEEENGLEGEVAVTYSEKVF